MMRRSRHAFTIAALTLAPALAGAQSLGTFRWQLQPYCNVITVQVTQVGSVYRLEGTDDRCGAGADLSSVIGTAFQNPDGTIGFGLNIVSTPGGAPVPVNADIALSSLSGTWRDSGGRSGNFVLTPGAGIGGTPRPTSSSSLIPPAFGLFSDGQFVARGTLGAGNIPASSVGVRMMWHPAKAAFRAGEVTNAVPTVWDDINIGVNSTAFGFDTLASGAWSTAFGADTQAVGPVSTAMGQNTQATSVYSTSMGNGTIASGISSTAMGSGTRAQGQASTAMGSATIASGLYSTVTGVSSVAAGQASFAVGNFAEANGATSFAAGNNIIAGGDRTVVLGSSARSLVGGSFMFGDASPGTVFAAAPNSFTARAAGGYWLYSNAALTSGVTLAAGGSGWSVISDVNMKENFRDLADNDLLEKIARMPVREWNYKTQDATIRHMGPTAQDFHAAFGLGEDERRINTIDADGVALAAVRALEIRTRELMEGNRLLVDDNRQLREAAEELRGRLEKLERLLLPKP
jgi:hypothetical protein